MRQLHAVTNTPGRVAILPLLIALPIAAIMLATRAHFVFVLPDEKGTKASVILSETL